ncbi:MAG: 16S rRNA (uracil(1498)-N(3))-methyltransferase [Nitrospirae bacterium]|nr:16S rRNA (uracil(1498)-N(3))-methyltransferase [Nitrospirota bacterium]
MPIFFIRKADLKDDRLVISGKLCHHLKNSLRHQVDDVIQLVDEEKTSYQVSITGMTDQSLEGKVLRREDHPPSDTLPLILAQALIKRKNMEVILQKAAELGVSEVVPLITERTIIHPQEGRWDHQRKRWEEILLEAAQQSEHLSPPRLHAPVDFKSWIRHHETGIGFIFWEKETRPLKQALATLPPLQSVSPVTLIIGPEGGLLQNEIDMAREKGYSSVSLGRHKLRSETAVLAAITLLQDELEYFGSATNPTI